MQSEILHGALCCTDQLPSALPEVSTTPHLSKVKRAVITITTEGQVKVYSRWHPLPAPQKEKMHDADSTSLMLTQCLPKSTQIQELIYGGRKLYRRTLPASQPASGSLLGGAGVSGGSGHATTGDSRATRTRLVGKRKQPQGTQPAQNQINPYPDVAQGFSALSQLDDTHTNEESSKPSRHGSTFPRRTRTTIASLSCSPLSGSCAGATIGSQSAGARCNGQEFSTTTTGGSKAAQRAFCINFE